MAVLSVVNAVLESLLAFVTRIGLWLFIAALAPTWLAVLFLIAIVLIPILKVVADDLSGISQPVIDLGLAVTAVVSIHQLLDWRLSLALAAVFAIPLVWNEYLFN